MAITSRTNRSPEYTDGALEGGLCRMRKEKRPTGRGNAMKIFGGVLGAGALLMGASYGLMATNMSQALAKPAFVPPRELPAMGRRGFIYQEPLYEPLREASPLWDRPMSALEVVSDRRLVREADYRQRLLAATMPIEARAVGDIEYAVLKRPDTAVDLEARERLILFSMFTHDGTIPADTRYLIENLRAQRDGVYAVIATDAPLLSIKFESEFLNLFRGAMLRDNHGLDFSAFAHMLRTFTDLWNATQLTFTNDSNFGPLDPEDFPKLYGRIDRSSSSFIGLTESVEGIEDKYHPHYQSFFTVVQNGGVQNEAVQEHWLEDIFSLSNKTEIIRKYELTLMPVMRRAGLSCEALFSLFDIDGGASNPSIVRPDTLIERGYPLLKKQLFKVASLRGYLDQVDLLAVQKKYPFDLEDIKIRGGYEPHALPAPT